MKFKRRYRLTFLIFLVIAINILVYFYDYNIRPVEQAVYKLENPSRDLMQNIKEPIIITFYESDNLNSREQHFADNVRNVLDAYKREATIPINFEFINPNESLEVEMEATNAGIQSIELRSQDNTLRKIFLGVIIQVGRRTEVLPMISPRMSIEYLISSSLRKLTESRRRKIAVVQGHGEHPISEISGVEKRLKPNYDLVPIILDSEIELFDYESLLIVSPDQKFTDSDLEVLDSFLNNGKNIFIALDRVEYDSVEQEGFVINTRLEEWLILKGLIVQSDFIVDNDCGDVQLEDLPGTITFPYFPQITNFPSHVGTDGVGAILLRYASSIEPVSRVGVRFTPLAKTSQVSGKKSLPLRITFDHEWSKADYLFPEQVVAAVLEGRLGTNGEREAKIAIISDGDVVMGGSNERRLDNHLFVANIIDWLSDTMGLAALKHKGVSQEVQEPIIKINTFMRYINLLLPLLMVACLALFFYYRRKWHTDRLRTANF